MDNAPTLEELRSQGLLTEPQELELMAWFRASCNSPQPLELPEELETALLQAAALHRLDQDEETMH